MTSNNNTFTDSFMQEIEKFKKDTKKMHDTAEMARDIYKGERGAEFIKTLKANFKGQKDLESALEVFSAKGSSDELLTALIDRHGTGRVLTRNRRSRPRRRGQAPGAGQGSRRRNPQHSGRRPQGARAAG